VLGLIFPCSSSSTKKQQLLEKLNHTSSINIIFFLWFWQEIMEISRTFRFWQTMHFAPRTGFAWNVKMRQFIIIPSPPLPLFVNLFVVVFRNHWSLPAPPGHKRWQKTLGITMKLYWKPVTRYNNNNGSSYIAHFTMSQCALQSVEDFFGLHIIIIIKKIINMFLYSAAPCIYLGALYNIWRFII
jgi:hypothetical protein